MPLYDTSLINKQTQRKDYTPLQHITYYETNTAKHVCACIINEMDIRYH